MSAGASLRVAMLAALRGDAALGALVNQIADGDQGKASPPAITIGEASETGWGARAVDGRALRVPLTVTDRGDGPAGVAGIVDAIDTALAAVPATIDGWRLLDLRFARSRLLSPRQGEWVALVDYGARLARII
jgi:hypothetical protein